MATADKIRNNIISKLLTISNEEYLTALYRLVEKTNADDDIVKLTEEQRKMLEFSEIDIKNGDLISQEQLDKEDREWLKGL